MDAAERSRLDALLRVPSVSADPDHAPDMRRAAEMLAVEIRRAGGVAEVRATDRHPLLVGHVPASEGFDDAPTVILYGHYDVQPPGPTELWSTGPFDPVERDGALYCRGVSDDKGNLFMLVVAVQRLAAAGALPVRAAFVIDGEEESGGDSALVHFRTEAGPADAALVFDMPMVRPGLAAICTGLRGLVYRRIRVRTATSDAHSGIYGGAALNAVHALQRVLAAAIPDDGRLHDDLYEGISLPDDAESAAWEELPAGPSALAEAGLRPADSEGAGAFYRRTFAEPAIDVHGLAAGDTRLVATSIPAVAETTLSLRVAPGQEASRLATTLDAILRRAAPEGADVEIDDLGVAGSTRIDPRHPALVAAADGIERALGVRPALVRTGGSIPVVAALAGAGIPTILSGFGLPDDAIHAADEHLRVEHLALGVTSAREILTALGGLPRP